MAMGEKKCWLKCNVTVGTIGLTSIEWQEYKFSSGEANRGPLDHVVNKKISVTRFTENFPSKWIN